MDKNKLIAELQAKVSELEKEKTRAFNNGYETGQKALTTNAEPVAWMTVQEGVFSPSFRYSFSETKKDGWIPLYTTPQTKPLSDEEIIKLFWDASWGTDEDVIKFARAIEERILGK